MKLETQKLFHRAIKAMKRADVMQVRIEFRRDRCFYDWDFDYSKTLEPKYEKPLESILSAYAVSVFESDATYNPIVHKRSNYGAIAVFVLCVDKPTVQIRFDIIKVDALAHGYLEYKELP